MTERFELIAALARDNHKFNARLSRRQGGHSEVAVVATVFGACLALAWLAETIARWLS